MTKIYTTTSSLSAPGALRVLLSWQVSPCGLPLAGPHSDTLWTQSQYSLVMFTWLWQMEPYAVVALTATTFRHHCGAISPHTSSSSPPLPLSCLLLPLP